MSVVRPGTVIWFCIVVAVGYAMFQVKYEVMQQEQTLAGINKQIADGREQIRVLDAEWSYLTRPGRIEQLAGRFLHLSTLSSAQIVDLAAVPERANAAATPHASDPTAPRMSPRIAAVVGKPVP